LDYKDAKHAEIKLNHTILKITGTAVEKGDKELLIRVIE
jgi:hypothetical protein